MNPISYKIDPIDSPAQTGQASRIVVRDKLNVYTIGNQHAPLIVVLESGQIQIFKDDVVALDVPYQEGFLTCKANHCEIHLLK